MESASPPMSSGRACWWHLPLVTPSFPRPETKAIPVGEPLDYLQLNRYEAELRRATDPGHLEQLAVDRQFVTKCLRHYNSLHMGDEYEHVSGEVSKHYHFRGGIWWVHGNFVARRKSSCCFSILPAPRTLFFYELVRRHGSEEVVTCTPLDEPMTEAYSILGFPLWWSARRTGRLDCICMTCSRRLDVYGIDLKRTLACGHKDVKKVCEMCYCCSDVLHPSPGEFAFGK